MTYSETVIKATIHAIKFGKITIATIHDNIMKKGYGSIEASEILKLAYDRRITG